MKLLVRLLLSVLVFACASVSASERDLLDALVSRGVLTDDAAEIVKKESAGIAENPFGNRVRFLAFWHLRYQYMDEHYSAADSPDDSYEKHNFAIRRIVPVVIANLTENSKAMFTLYLPSNWLINTARYQYDIDEENLCGSFWLGYEYVFFCMEEPESGMRLLTPDRSIVNMYFGSGDGYVKWNTVSNNIFSSNEAFSGYHTGAYWHGKFAKNKSLIYRLAVTNSKPGEVMFDNCTGLAFWASLGVDHEEDGNRYRFGVNAGYSTRVVSAVRHAAGYWPPEDYGDCIGVNPYIWLYVNNWTFVAEYVATSLKYGRTIDDERPLYTIDSPRANPIGFYFLLAYKFDINPFGEFEPVFRYSRVNSNGRGIDETVMYMAEMNDGLFDSAEAYYVGFNWYLMGQTLKYQVGGEFVRLRDAPFGTESKKSDLFVFITQVQLIF